MYSSNTQDFYKSNKKKQVKCIRRLIIRKLCGRKLFGNERKQEQKQKLKEAHIKCIDNVYVYFRVIKRHLTTLYVQWTKRALNQTQSMLIHAFTL